MLSTRDDSKKLEKLLEKLFDNTTTSDEVFILQRSRSDILLNNCCTISYTNYGA